MKREILTKVQPDRRILVNIPDPEHIRSLNDRRGYESTNETEIQNLEHIYIQKLQGQRYTASFDVFVKTGHRVLKFKSVNISNTGILICREELSAYVQFDQSVSVRFNLPPGTMPEGFESKVHMKAKIVREFKKDGQIFLGLHFEESLTEFLKTRRWGISIFTASMFLLLFMLIVILMRTESVIYFKFNKFLYFYSMVAAAFLLSRYIFGLFYKSVSINMGYEPGVTIIIPVFNEEEWIHRTIISCIDQTYPIEKLEVIIVDDCSNDQTVKKVYETIERINLEGARFQTESRIQFFPLSKNVGKREALVEGVKHAKFDLVVFVDSDSFLEPNAIRHLVQPFQDPQVGGVTGRTEVENKYTNVITKLQAVRYYIAFRIMKAAESFFDTVTCLSGPLSCYRKELVQLHEQAWLTQQFLGHPATFGDDRSMTNYILKTHRTTYQDAAVCSTIVPSDFHVFLKQQMRWKRSWLRESIRAFTFMWKKEPFMFLFFIVGFIVPIAAPLVVTYNLLYVPIVHHIFPLTFIVGLCVMAFLMSFAHLLFKKSKLWFFGIIFVLFYEFILLWQMPIAWFTFWKSTWGTRETPQDIEEQERKAKKKSNIEGHR